MVNVNVLLEAVRATPQLQVVVLQQHLMYVQQEKQQQQLTHVIVQAGQHLLEQVELELVNVQTIILQLIQQQDVVLQHQVIVLLE